MASFTNTTTILQRDRLTRVLKHIKKDFLKENTDRIPHIMRLLDEEHIRCCVYKDRAMLKYRIMGILGFGTNDETDELTPLAEYYDKARKRNHIEKEQLSVMDVTCTACVKNSYVVANMCHGCQARPYATNCLQNGQAYINSAKCVNCSLCIGNCSYNAIIFIHVPCEQTCFGNIVKVMACKGGCIN